MSETKVYVAYGGLKAGRRISRITSVMAQDLASGRKRIEEELSRPGRYHILDQWRAHGAVVRTEGAVEGVTVWDVRSVEFPEIVHTLWNRDSAEHIADKWESFYSNTFHPAGIVKDRNARTLFKQDILLDGEVIDFQFNKGSMGRRNEKRTVMNIWMEVDGSAVWGEVVYLSRVVQVRRGACWWTADHVIKYSN